MTRPLRAASRGGIIVTDADGQEHSNLSRGVDWPVLGSLLGLLAEVLPGYTPVAK